MQSADLSQSNTPDDTLDITHETCPMTYVRTRLKLDRMRSGQVLEIRLRGADAVNNVPRTAIAQGHTVISRELDGDGVTILRLRRA
jgi:tRNA 2-thiouridine synthesizing protein A